MDDIYAGRGRAVGGSLGQFRAMNAQGNLRGSGCPQFSEHTGDGDEGDAADGHG